MSSLQENSTVSLDEKRKSFFRSDSFDRLQFSAYYSLQLAGSILSLDTLLQLFDALLQKSRDILRRAVMLLSLPAFKMCCAIVLFWIDTFTKYTGINVVFEKKIVTSTNVEPEKTYILRVQKRKVGRPSEGKATAIVEPTVAAEPAIVAATPAPPSPEPLKPIAEVDLNAHPRVSFPKLTKFDSESELSSSSSISSRQNYGLPLIVYGSATLVYIQLMILAVFLQTATTPPGLVFLVSSLGFIGYIVFKMCFVKSKVKDEIATLATTPANKSQSAPSDESHISSIRRMSRSTTRRFLYFHNKTLSKIKLL